MDEVNRPITFRQLLDGCSRIEVPLIQRDYAQGRATEKEVRDHFLKALHDALSFAPGPSPRPLNLDFVYGSMEGGDLRSFLPLDGQQRLTTLFLLHWYLAWRDEQLLQFQDMFCDRKHSRFTYGVRPSSREFFDELVRYVPDTSPDKVPTLKRQLENQPWFFLHWRLDPTIQSALVMLEAIHGLFKLTTNLFSRLIDSERPAITFQLLRLEHFGLADDLYIKMNARGKPLTPFETFKARFEEFLVKLYPTETRELGGATVSVAEFFERRIDTQWTDFFWTYKSLITHTFDDAVVSLLVALARVSLNPASPSFDRDTMLLRGRQLGNTFSLFHERGWLTREFASNLMYLLEAWSSGGGKLSPVLPDSRYFDEAAFFGKAIQEPSALDYTQLVQFGAFVFYLRYHEGSANPTDLNEWMRVVHNLSVNSEIERSEEYGRCLAGLLKILPHSKQILEHLSATDVGQIGFSPQQVREETLKAKLVLTNYAWRSRIDDAESHGYFNGQIEFILDFSGVSATADRLPVTTWELAQHEKLQAAFDRYLKKAQFTFTSSGLASTEPAASYFWQRALLACGNYLVSTGRNLSFVTDPPSNRDSWKRFLRGGANGRREHLKALWDRVDTNAEIEPQLDQIITAAADLEPWRAAIVKHPKIIAYCGQRAMRFENNFSEIYLLQKSQMNGAHAELYSYVFYLELDESDTWRNLAPLSLQPYRSVTMTEVEPHVLLGFHRSGHQVSFAIESRRGQFCIYAKLAELEVFPELGTALRSQGQFSAQADYLVRSVPRPDTLHTLQDLAKILANLPR